MLAEQVHKHTVWYLMEQQWLGDRLVIRRPSPIRSQPKETRLSHAALLALSLLSARGQSCNALKELATGKADSTHVQADRPRHLRDRAQEVSRQPWE